MVDTGARILIVDDEPMNVKLLAAQLNSQGYEVLTAYGGEEALSKVRADQPDLVLLDIMMPDLDGYAVTKAMKEDEILRNIPVILVTALDGHQDKLAGLEVGADEFLNKPVHVAELLARVKSLVRLKRYRDQLRDQQAARTLYSISASAVPSANLEMLPSILVVEDDAVDARLIQGYLHGEPYCLQTAADGEETISRVRREKIDLILLDILLPGLDGLEVCRQIKDNEVTKNVQILMVTALQDLEMKIKGIELGADDYLVKPINRQELQIRVKALIKKKAYLDSLQANYERALQTAIMDPLTGLYNHGYFHHLLEGEIKRAIRLGQPLGLMLMDVDDFKMFNDTFGHLAGDDILKRLGELIRRQVREMDYPARYGGDEFAAILGNTNREEALKVAERIREKLAEQTFPYTIHGRNLSVSMGIALKEDTAQDPRVLVQRADQAMYLAKKKGKGRIEIASN